MIHVLVVVVKNTNTVTADKKIRLKIFLGSFYKVMKMNNAEIKTSAEDVMKHASSVLEMVDKDSLKNEERELEKRTYDSSFWDDHKKASKVTKEIKRLKNKIQTIEMIEKYIEDITIYLEFLEMDEDVETELLEKIDLLTLRSDKFETSLLLNGPHDSSNAIMEIHPGAGGTESQDWADMLYRMYRRHAEQNQYEFELIDYLPGDEAGLKRVSFIVKGVNAYGYLKAEDGVHRLVRISPFDSGGRRHTSFASVGVIPELDDDIDVEIAEKDLKIDTYRSSGAGGQSVNTTDSAVRITHLPTKTVVTVQNERSQIQNREKAMQILRAKLYVIEEEKQREAISQFKNSDQANAFGSQIRSYVMHPYSMVKDHRTNYETGNVGKVMDGDIDPFIDAYLKHCAKEES
jgi:peptide chain release factor 2